MNKLSRFTLVRLYRFLHVFLLAGLLGFCFVFLASAQAQPTALTASGWGIAPVATVGQNGFTDLFTIRVGNEGTMVVGAIRNGVEGIYLIRGSRVITVVTPGKVLSGTLGTIAVIDYYQYGVDPQGRVLFAASVTDSSLPVPDSSSQQPVFRWDNGLITHMLPSAANIRQTASNITSRGQWLAETYEGPFANGTRSFQITNGTVVTPVVTFVESAANCRWESTSQFAATNVHGGVLYYSSIVQRPIAGPDSCDIFAITTRDWTLGVASPGVVNNTIAGGQLLEGGGFTKTNGVNVSPENYFINDNGDVVYVKDIHTESFGVNTPTSRQIVLHDASGETVLLDTTSSIRLVGFDNTKRVGFQLVTDSGSTSAIYAGPNLQTDRVIGSGDMLFGQEVSSLMLFDVSSPPGTFGDKRVFAFTYSLADGTTGVAVASKGITRWINPSGGSWDTAGNWSPNEVPDSATETVFDLEETYDVTVGTRQSGRSSIQNGSVGFRNANLELLGPLSVGNDGSLTVPEGKVTVGELIVGNLPPVDAANHPHARLMISNQGTVFTTTGQTLIGNAGNGELFVSDSRLDSTEVRIGAGAPGTVVVGSPNGVWNTGSLAVGYGFTGTLTIERGAAVNTRGQAIIGEGTTAQPYPAVVAIDNGGTTAQPPWGNWSIFGTLTIGNYLPGLLTMDRGGVVGVFGPVQLGLVAHNNPAAFDGAIEIVGVGDDATTPSQLIGFEEMLVGMNGGTRTSVMVSDGGKLYVNKLSLAHETGSVAYLKVVGVTAGGIRSTLEAGTVGGGEQCAIGWGGQALAQIRDGAFFECPLITIGGQIGSSGHLFVGGSGQGQVSAVMAKAMLCVGGNLLCDTNEAVRGRLTLQNDGLVSTHVLVVGQKGRITGNGTVVVFGDLGMLNAGQIDPGIEITDSPPLEPLTPRASNSDGTAYLVKPGTLTISGSVSFSDTSIVTLDVTGKTAFDRLVISGTAQLTGKLQLKFSNGYAPKQGDTFTFVQAESASGDFENVEITGLADGFLFDLTTTGGQTQLVANNDGVATTQPNTKNVYLPLVLR